MRKEREETMMDVFDVCACVCECLSESVRERVCVCVCVSLMNECVCD